ncbi:tetratricopeptide repeat protein [Streptomyces mexicanus]|uniref:Tetratricopeptide repeat protein n=1 Tax=Streptomyces mexicanus TaxID=178566 RepID=A0A7X1HUX1_9ACTN|nr:tetratricopeptide repeat protein [Streptomyces mexicanus]MBC2863492.1 tetratricopeptide repeat protein [Streptomyces mexicanus]
MTSAPLELSGAGQVLNFGINTGVMYSTVTTVVLPAEALRSAADTPADGVVHLDQPPPGRFAGRQDELASIRAVLTAERAGPGVSAVVVHGLGGVGKSTLARQYAHTFRETYDLVWWIDASSPGKIDEALAGIARLLSPVWAGTAQQPELTSWALAWLQRHTAWLLVYDNVEDPALLKPFLGSLGGGHHLITSRLADDWDDLGAADGALLPLGVLPQVEAADLLWSWVSEGDPSDASRWQTGQLARELGGLPLALDQAGAYLRRTRSTVAAYRGRLGLHLSRTPARRDPQQTVARIWQVTLTAIAADDPSAVELLYALAWLDPDECPRDLVTRLAADEIAADDALGVLHAYSMIAFTGRNVRVHRLVQSVLRADAVTAAPGAHPGESAPGRPRGRHEAEQALLQMVHPRGADQAHDAQELARLAGQVCALAATDPKDCYSTPVSALYVKTAVHLEEQGQTVRALPLYEAYSAQIERGLGHDHPYALVARCAVARVYETVGRPQDAVDILEPTLEQSLRLHGPGHLTTLNLRHGLASAHRSAGRVDRAIDEYETATAASREALGPDHLRTLTLQGDLAGAYESVGRVDQAIALYEDIVQRDADASDRYEDLVPSLKLNGLRLRNNLAGAYESAGRFQQAITLYEEVLADFEDVCGPDHPDTLSCLGNLGYAYESAGDLGRAQEVYRDVLGRREQALGEDHPDTLLSRSNLACLCLTTGDVPTGLDLCRTTLAQRTGVLGPEHPDTLVSLSMLASAHLAAGEQERAVALFEETLRLRRKVLGDAHPDTLRSLLNLATCHYELGDAARAVPLLETALAEQERLLGAESRDALISRNNLAAACRAAGDLGRARALFTTVVEQRTRILGPDHLDTLGSRAGLARVYEASGELDRAIPLYESTLTRLTELAGADHPLTGVVAGLLAEASGRREQDCPQP